MKSFHLQLVCLPIALLIFLMVWCDAPHPGIAHRVQAADKVVVWENGRTATTDPAELTLLKGMFVGGEGNWMRCGGGALAFYQGQTLLASVDFQIGHRGDRPIVALRYAEWGKSVLLGSCSLAAAALVERMAEGKCDCESQRRSAFARR